MGITDAQTATGRTADVRTAAGPTVTARTATARLELTRTQILAHRRHAGALDERLPPGAESLRRAAWAGLQDSVPRAALLSIHARVAGAGPLAWEDPSLVQLWGPRYAAYVVSALDVPAFSLGRLPDDAAGRRRAEDLASRLHDFLGGRRMTYSEAGHALGVNPNQLRYAAETGRVLIRWEGAGRPAIWTVPAPSVDARDARLELARRFLHVLGPGRPAAFAKWAGIRESGGGAAFDALAGELTPVRTPIGDAWILAADEPAFRVVEAAAEATSERSASPGGSGASSTVRFLPSGDAYTLLYGADRELLVPNATNRAALWTPRVWPGALLVDGEIVGTWRRNDAAVTVQTWRRFSSTEREAVEVEAASLPLLGLTGPIVVGWEP